MRTLRSAALPALLPTLLVLLAATPARAQAQRKLAVLEFSLEVEEKIDRTYFADRVREVVRQQLPAEQFFIMTRESTEELLRAGGKTLADCVGNCEVETGRLLSADLVISGRITRVGSRYKLSMRLHQMRDGALVSSATASGDSVDKLDDATQAAAEDLVSPIAPQAAPRAPGPVAAKPRNLAILSVTSTPPGALLSVDGQERGTTPTSLELRPGKHVVEASLADYARATKDLTLALSDKPERLALNLERLHGRVSVAANAACRCSAGEASFSVDAGGVEVVDLPTGSASLECKTSDGRTARASTDVATEGLATARLTFDDPPRPRAPDPEPETPHERTGWMKRFDRPLSWGLVLGLGEMEGKDVGSGIGMSFDGQLRLADTLLLEAGVQAFLASRDGANAGDPSISTTPVGFRGAALLTPFDLGPFRPYGGARVIRDNDALGTGVAIVAGVGLDLGSRWSLEWQGGQTGWLAGTSSYLLTVQPVQGWGF